MLEIIYIIIISRKSCSSHPDCSNTEVEIILYWSSLVCGVEEVDTASSKIRKEALQNFCYIEHSFLKLLYLSSSP